MFTSQVRQVAVVTLAALIAGGGVGIAFALDSADSPRDPLSAEDVYSDSMSLEEIARASNGRPGEVAPPCPPEDAVTQLKVAGLDVGPCDPVLRTAHPS